MTDKDYTIRKMTRQELAYAVDWAAREGWNPGLHDADCFYAADPEGFLAGLLGDEIVATVSAVRYGDSYGFAGFYIVAPRHRGKGFGLAIARTAMDRLEGRIVGLDGVLEQQENYKKLGFSIAFRNIRQEGKGGGGFPRHPDVVDLAALPFETVDAFDRVFFPAGRTGFLKAWIGQPDSRALGCLKGGALAGLGVIRRCRTGHKIGPLYADSPKIAEALFQSLAAGTRPGEPVFLDTPEINPHALALAKNHRMKPAFETARMYKGTPPDIPLDRLYGITSFELG